MAKHRVRVKGNKKGRQRWAKGQSGASNPSRTKFRDAAKNKSLKGHGFGKQKESTFNLSSSTPIHASDDLNNSGRDIPNKLTAECLLRHEAALGQIDSSSGGTTVHTSETFASDWSGCTNVSFAKLMTKFSPNNEHHKEMLAILAAVTEVIKSKGGEESSTEYLAALLTTLESAETEKSLAASVGLIALVIKTVPRPVLIHQFDAISKLLLQLLARQAEAKSTGEANNSEGGTATTRSLMSCLSVLLRAQNAEAWIDTSGIGPIHRVFDSILSFCLDSKPRVRKSAHQTVISILKGSTMMKTSTMEAEEEKENKTEMDVEETKPTFHPASINASKYCTSQIEKYAVSSSSSDGASRAVLHVLSLLKEIISVFPKSHVKICCETVLKVMSSGDSYTVSSGMQVLYGLFNSRPDLSSLPIELNAKLINLLYNYQPSINDAQPIVAWLTVQQEALINLSQHDHQLCIKHLPKFVLSATRCWTSDKSSVITAATTAIKAICLECIKPYIQIQIEDSEMLVELKKVFNHLEEGLKYQYHSAWAQVLHILATYIDVTGHTKCNTFMGNCLRQFCDLRASINFRFTNELDYVVGKCIRKMGPEVVLNYIPLNITGKEKNFDFPRSWMLPIMRENIQNARLGFFISHFLPMQNACKARALQAQNDKEVAIYKTYEILFYQIWALLPGFCNNPSDLKESFSGSFAKLLGDNLNIRELRLDILSALRQLILKAALIDENKLVISKKAKNYLPILFNLYTSKPNGSEEAGQRQSIFETIKLFLSIADQILLQDLFDKALSEYKNSADDFKVDACLDLLQGMLPYQQKDRIADMYTICSSQVTGSDAKKQKKAYRVLEELFRSNNMACRDFVLEHLEEIQQIFIQALSKDNPSSKGYRLKCLINIVRNLEGNHTDFAYKILPEAILCIKATNEKARTNAYTLLIVICEALQRWQNTTKSMDEIVKDFLKQIFAGLAGNPTVVHCTLLAITRIYYEFKDVFPEEVIEMLVNNVCLLLTSHSKEVVGSAISFLRVFVTTDSVLKIAKYVENIVGSLVKMPESCQRHFRLKSRYLLDRLTRKFGFDFISAMIPKNDLVMQKRMKNIRKIQAKRQKTGDETRDASGIYSDEDEDDQSFRVKAKPKSIEDILADSDEENDAVMGDNEDEEREGRKPKKNKKKHHAFIAENEGKSIVDFLDPSAAQNVTSTLPKNQKMSVEDTNQKVKNGGFQIAKDGRLIIEESDSEEEKPKDKKLHFMDSDGSDDEGDSKNTFRDLVNSSSAKKRKHGGSIASSKRTTMSLASDARPMKYQAGGSGIHRPLNGNQNAQKFPDYGAEYRAKKGKGDIKRKDKPDPYAYVPLKKESLNKRKRAKFDGQFKGLVKAAQKGSAAGKKSGKIVKKMKHLKM